MKGLFDCNGRWAAGRCYLYVAMARLDAGPMFVKIGISDDPPRRVRALQTGCPLPISKAGMIKCLTRAQAVQLEAELHAALADKLSIGEWFRFEWQEMPERELLQARIATVMAVVPDWKLEEIDLDSTVAMMRILADSTGKAVAARRRLGNRSVRSRA